MMEMILRTSGLATLRDQASLFVLAASDELVTLTPVVKALKKASLPNIQTADLPVVRSSYVLPACPQGTSNCAHVVNHK